MTVLPLSARGYEKFNKAKTNDQAILPHLDSRFHTVTARTKSTIEVNN
jgi:hypothetical protein